MATPRCRDPSLSLSPAIPHRSAAVFGEHLYVGTYICGPLWLPPFEVWRTEGGLFVDGFESGDTSAWSATVPQGTMLN